jgi:hypothetical protein
MRNELRDEGRRVTYRYTFTSQMHFLLLITTSIFKNAIAASSNFSTEHSTAAIHTVSSAVETDLHSCPADWNLKVCYAYGYGLYDTQHTYLDVYLPFPV